MMNEFSDEKIVGMTRGSTDSFFSVDSPLGTLYVAVGPRGVKYSTLSPASDEEFVRHYGELFGRLAVPAEEDEVGDLAEKISASFDGGKVEVPLDLIEKTPFQRRVMEVVSKIPHGEVRPYSWVAEEAGASRASRAVGSVMARNPMPLIVPCHRVIRNDGKTGNYGFDPEKKVRLLKREGVPVDDIAKAPYLAAATTGIICHATCRDARRIKPEDRRSFRSISDAMDAGFVPCEVCRPVVAA